jgi:Trk-type K+ transport system membrane component
MHSVSTASGKAILSFAMILGRLEIFTLLGFVHAYLLAKIVFRCLCMGLSPDERSPIALVFPGVIFWVDVD